MIGMPKWRTGNFLSRVMRLIFEKPKTKKIFGVGLPVMMIIMSQFTAMVATGPVQAQTPPSVISQPEKVLITKHTFQRPVEGEVSQGYHWYHQAVDIANNDKAEVKAVATGQVIETGYQFLGLGNFVVVQHGETMTSTYGHLSEIRVKVGNEVKLKTVLGKIGSTGRSTGPHLHLEIMDVGAKLNPYSLIEGL